MKTPRRIPVSNGLLEGVHRARIGPAVWEFLWAIDRTTDEYQGPDGKRRGRVKAGEVIRLRQIADECGSRSLFTTRDNIARLAREGYLVINEVAGRGLVIEVANSKKWMVTPRDLDRVGTPGTRESKETAARQESPLRKTVGVEAPNPNGKPSATPTENRRGAARTPTENRRGPLRKTVGVPTVQGTSVHNPDHVTPGKNPEYKESSTPCPADAVRVDPDSPAPAKPYNAKQARGYGIQQCLAHFSAERQRLKRGPALPITNRHRACMGDLLDSIHGADGGDYIAAEATLKILLTTYLKQDDAFLGERDYDLLLVPSRLGSLRHAARARQALLAPPEAPDWRPDPKGDAEVRRLFGRNGRKP